ncbi:MAG: phosphoglycerate kinase [Caldimicrobium sp.]|nr:phosphoglycerate kinase [Caldimicrobium sp.]MCX7874278.1 phosphoglycerate kinase [Caldimicrobium sp.]MDW8093915.1 phosphoglycerate kinase [Caldimicrobium sp.]
MKTIRDFDLRGKRVFIRVDFNVPLENGEILDDTRIVEALPTIEYALKAGGKVILCSHLGRPKGKRVPELSLKPVFNYLQRKLKTTVKFLEDLSSEQERAQLSQLKEGEVLLLENIRYYDGETKNEPELARLLASFTDVFINDAFSVCHRAHASVVGIAELVKEKGIGFLTEKELKYLTRVIGKPERPFYAIIGGSKVSTKIGILKNLLPRIDKLIIGGAMANTFLYSLGYNVGASQVEREYLDIAKDILYEAKEQEVKIYLPVDVVVERKGQAYKVSLEEVEEEDQIFDIGEETVRYFSLALEGAKTIIWNGPLGYFEKEPFQWGTTGVARRVAALNAVTVAGGGDTLSALKKAGVLTAFSHTSTAGGAFLEYLEGKELPGLAVLK